VLEHAALTRAGTCRLFAVQDVLEHVVNERAMAYGLGERFKRKLTRYHGYAFLSSLTPRPVRNAFSFACPCSIGLDAHAMRCWRRLLFRSLITIEPTQAADKRRNLGRATAA
jgi:hypothetical protein